jgi:hypothetical protein
VTKLRYWSRDRATASTGERRRAHRTRRRGRAKAMKHTENIDLAWAAGFIDGEGHMGVHVINDRRGATDVARRQRLAVRIVVGQCNHEPLDFLATLFGGSIRLRNQRTSTNREQWVWELGTANKVAAAICRLRPYLRVKGDEADGLLAICQRMAAWPRGTRLTEQEIEARNELAQRLHDVKQGTRAPARRIEPTLWGAL